MFHIDLSSPASPSSGLSGRRDCLRVLAATAVGLGAGIPRIANAAPAVPAEKPSVSPQPVLTQ